MPRARLHGVRYADTMLAVSSVLVDFDGTASPHDVAEHVLEEFANADWRALDEALERGEAGTYEVIRGQAAMLAAADDDLVTFATSHCAIDPTFAPFVRWLREHDVETTIVSDGFGFYIPPMLAAVGLDDVPVITNTWSTNDGARISFENGHPGCVGCGTCKMRAVLDARARGPVAFVGEGTSDRYGALYADVVFAKDVLVRYCEADGVRYLPWDGFDDVRRALESLDELPGPVAPVRCPGWTPA
jgi:2-hydroxy-3-keto-5-methylthiopentenyl-1-phosphate phosphatase